MSHGLRLVADIGGTHARFAIVPRGARSPARVEVMNCADFPDLESAVRRYLSNAGQPAPVEAAFAVATPVSGDRVKLTNQAWSFSIADTRRRLGLQRLLVLNDFAALALALPGLKGQDLRQIGPGRPSPNAAKALVGPGTGLGVSGLIPVGHRWTPLCSEGGHTTYSAVTERERQVCDCLRAEHGHVSAERLISGMGLVNVYRALAQLDGVAAQDYSAARITELGASGAERLCAEVLEMFCGMLGTFAGNLALTLGARGGVYVAGGIVPRFTDYFARSQFRERFGDKGRFCDYLSNIPTYVVTTPHLALTGAVGIFDLEDVAAVGGAAAPPAGS